MPRKDGTPTKGELKLMRIAQRAQARLERRMKYTGPAAKAVNKIRSHKQHYGKQKSIVPEASAVFEAEALIQPGDTTGTPAGEGGGGSKGADGTLVQYPPPAHGTPERRPEELVPHTSYLPAPGSIPERPFVRTPKSPTISAEGPLVRTIQHTGLILPEPVKIITPAAPAIHKGNSRVVVLPNEWQPREYQVPVMSALDSGQDRAITVWHRRAGKDSTAANYTAKCTPGKIGTYWHVLPTAKQARKVVWEGIDKQGRRIIDQVFPKSIRRKTRDDDMMIELKSGSIWRLVGGDNYDSLVGSNVVGAVFSEFSLMDPLAWRYSMPILRENGGWAWFIFTPRGKNHAHAMLEMAKGNPAWFQQILTARDTNVVTEAMIQEDRASGMPEELIKQEYYCSFEAALVGAVYGKEMEAAEKAKRFTSLSYDPRFPVETWWDLGLNDATCITFAQRVDGNRINVFDYEETRNVSLVKNIGTVLAKGYTYSRHIAPHDIETRELSTAERRIDIARNHGINFVVAPKLPLEDGIEAVRNMLPRMVFDAEKCGRLVSALQQYRREWNEDRRTLDAKPVHDWTSHPADSVRTGAVVPDFAGIMPGWFTEAALAHAMGRKFSVADILRGTSAGPQNDTADPLAAYN